jgi:hypothetical protein
MSETNVTPLHPAEAPVRRRQAHKRLDPTNAERQRRHRERLQEAEPTAASNVTPQAAPVPSSTGLPWSVWPLATVTIGLMAVSLTHLSGGIEDLTSIPSWQSWAMAIGIDALLVATALAQLTAQPEVKRDIAVVAHLMEGVTLVMSAGLNSLAFSGGHFDLAHWAPIAFGCYVPAMISGSTYLLARLTRR